MCRNILRSDSGRDGGVIGRKRDGPYRAVRFYLCEERVARENAAKRHVARPRVRGPQGGWWLARTYLDYLFCLQISTTAHVELNHQSNGTETLPSPPIISFLSAAMRLATSGSSSARRRDVLSLALFVQLFLYVVRDRGVPPDWTSHDAVSRAA